MSGQKILIIKLGALGDFVQAFGPMAAIRHHHPDAHITLMTTAPFLKLAQESGLFDTVWIDERPKFHQWKKWKALYNHLNQGGYSLVYDLQNNDRTEIYGLLFRRRPSWVGAGRVATIRNTSPTRNAGLAFDGHVQTLGLAGITGIKVDRLEWVKGKDSFEGLSSPYILIVPGSAPQHPEKRWPGRYYMDLCRRLAERGFQSVLIGGEAERAVTDEIAQAVPQCLNLRGQTDLFDIVALARNAQGAIGNDTGPMHMIAPTGVPTIVLFSSQSNPVRHAPKGHNVVTIQKDVLEDLSPDRIWKAFCDQQGLSV